MSTSPARSTATSRRGSPGPASSRGGSTAPSRPRSHVRRSPSPENARRPGSRGSSKGRTASRGKSPGAKRKGGRKSRSKSPSKKATRAAPTAEDGQLARAAQRALNEQRADREAAEAGARGDGRGGPAHTDEAIMRLFEAGEGAKVSQLLGLPQSVIAVEMLKRHRRRIGTLEHTVSHQAATIETMQEKLRGCVTSHELRASLLTKVTTQTLNHAVKQSHDALVKRMDDMYKSLEDDIKACLHSRASVEEVKVLSKRVSMNTHKLDNDVDRALSDDVLQRLNDKVTKADMLKLLRRKADKDDVPPLMRKQQTMEKMLKQVVDTVDEMASRPVVSDEMIEQITQGAAAAAQLAAQKSANFEGKAAASFTQAVTKSQLKRTETQLDATKEEVEVVTALKTEAEVAKAVAEEKVVEAEERITEVSEALETTKAVVKEVKKEAEAAHVEAESAKAEVQDAKAETAVVKEKQEMAQKALIGSSMMVAAAATRAAEAPPPEPTTTIIRETKVVHVHDEPISGRGDVDTGIPEELEVGLRLQEKMLIETNRRLDEVARELDTGRAERVTMLYNVEKLTGHVEQLTRENEFLHNMCESAAAMGAQAKDTMTEAKRLLFKYDAEKDTEAARIINLRRALTERIIALEVELSTVRNRVAARFEEVDAKFGGELAALQGGLADISARVEPELREMIDVVDKHDDMLDEIDSSLRDEIKAANVRNSSLVFELRRHQVHYRKVIEEYADVLDKYAAVARDCGEGSRGGEQGKGGAKGGNRSLFVAQGANPRPGVGSNPISGVSDPLLRLDGGPFDSYGSWPGAQQQASVGVQNAVVVPLVDGGPGVPFGVPQVLPAPTALGRQFLGLDAKGSGGTGTRETSDSLALPDTRSRGPSSAGAHDIEGARGDPTVAQRGEGIIDDAGAVQTRDASPGMTSLTGDVSPRDGSTHRLGAFFSVTGPPSLVLGGGGAPGQPIATHHLKASPGSTTADGMPPLPLSSRRGTSDPDEAATVTASRDLRTYAHSHGGGGGDADVFSITRRAPATVTSGTGAPVPLVPSAEGSGGPAYLRMQNIQLKRDNARQAAFIAEVTGLPPSEVASRAGAMRSRGSARGDDPEMMDGERDATHVGPALATPRGPHSTVSIGPADGFGGGGGGVGGSGGVTTAATMPLRRGNRQRSRESPRVNVAQTRARVPNPIVGQSWDELAPQ